MRITPAVRHRAVVVLALLAIWAPGSASRPLPALPFYTGHAFGQSLAEHATLSSQQDGRNAELFSQHHGDNPGLLQDIISSQQHYPPHEPAPETWRSPHSDNPGLLQDIISSQQHYPPHEPAPETWRSPHSDRLLQDITGHWSGFPHQAHPSDHYSLEHQLSHSQLQGLHHSAEHSNPSFGHKAGADGTLFSIPFAQNQYPTAQQPSPAQVSDFVAHLQAMLNYQYYHQGFLDHSSDDYYHHHHEGQHWQEQGGYSDSPSDVKLEPLREALGSPPRHLQVQPPYPFHNQHQQQAWLAQRDPSAAAGSYPPQANVEHPYPFNDQPHQYHDQPVYGTSAVLAPGQQSRIQPGPHSAHAGPGSFTYGQQGTGFDPHGISYANQPARWSHHVGDAAAASKNDMLSIGQWLKTKTEGHSFDVIPGNINERETVLKRVKEIVRKTPWRNDAVVQQVDDIRWRDDIEAKPLKEYQNAIRSMKKYMDDERPPTEDWAEIAFEYIRFDTENLIVRFKAFDQRVSPIPSTPGFGLYRIVAKRKEQDKKCLYVGDLLVPNDFNKEYWGQKKKPHSEAS